MDFSKLILLRNKKDLTQREMAKILNVSKSTYARWETQEEIILYGTFLITVNILKLQWILF